MAVVNLLFFGCLLILMGFTNAETVNANSSIEIVTANASETAVLICPKSSDIVITFWTGPPGLTAYNFPGSTVIQLPDATRLEINETNAALLIHNVTLDDEGLYICSATGLGTAELQLDVTNIPPTSIVVDNIQQQGNRTTVHGTEDQNLTLICSAGIGKPESIIIWSSLNTNETFPSNTSVAEYENGTFAVFSSLTFLANRSLDGVVYTCSVHHPALDSPVELDVEIYLDLKPQLGHIEEQTITIEGFNTSLSCKVFGARPESNVTLYFNGEPVADANQDISVYNESSETYSTTAEFHRLMERTYNRKTVSCVVYHLTLDSPINRTWTIVVHYPPSVSVTGANTTALSESISLECFANNGNPDNYTFSQWQHTWPSYNNILQEISSTSFEINQATLQLRNLTFQDSGYYKCLASNGVGVPNNPAFVAEQDVYIVVKDVPYIVDGRTEYLSANDEEIEIVIEVYTNVDPIHVSIERNSDSVGTTAIWTIMDKIPETVGVSVYNHKILKSGYRIPVHFEVQAEKNYGAYRIVIRNDIGSTYHNFSVLPREKESTVAPAAQDESNNDVVAIVVGTVVPVVVVAAVVVGIIIYCKCKQKPTNNGKNDPAHQGTRGSKKYIKDTGDKDSHYDYINPTGESGPKDDGYLEPQSPKFKAEYWEYTKGDEKVVYKKIEGSAPPGMDHVDLAGSMKLPSLTMNEFQGTASPATDQDDMAGSMKLPSLTITEVVEEEIDGDTNTT